MKLSNWVEIVGTVAVVVSLAFVALELRQNTQALTSQSYDARTAALREINLHNADAEWLWEIQAKLDDHFGKPTYLVDASVDEWRDALQTLSPTERYRFFYVSLTVWNHYQNMFFQGENGYLDPALYEATKSAIKMNATFWVALGLSAQEETEFDRFIRSATKKE